MTNRRSKAWAVIWRIPRPIRLVIAYSILWPLGVTMSLIAGVVSGAIIGGRDGVAGFLNGIKREFK